MRQLSLAVIFNTIGPALFLIATSFGLQSYHQSAYELGFNTIFEVCPGLIQVVDDARVKSECAELQTYGRLQPLAWLTFAGGLVAPLLASFLPVTLGSNRVLLAGVFPPLFRLTVLAATMLMIAGALWTILAIHIFMAYTIGVIWYYAYLALGLAFLGILYRSFRSAWRSLQSSKTVQFGALSKPDDAPFLYEIISELCRTIGVPKPANIIIGADPTFFVTNAPIHLLPSKQAIRGESLYISAALLRLLSKNEVKAVVAHELMHYKGNDLAYTKRFAPIYHTLHGFIAELSQANNPFTLPLLANLSVLDEGFSKSERRISREREFEADKGAAKAASAKDLLSALIKVSVFTHLWDQVLDDNARAQQQGEFLTTIGDSLFGYAVYSCDEVYITSVFDHIATQPIQHPTDTHPSLALRAQNVGLEISEVELEFFEEFERDKHRSRRVVSPELNQEIANAFHIQTILRHNPAIPASDDSKAEIERGIYRVIYQIAEHFIRVDGKIVPSEVRRAEELGQAFFPKFNPLLFRELLHSDDKPLPAIELANLAADVFTEAGIQSVKKLVYEIISADDEVSPQEALLFKAFFKQINKRLREATRESMVSVSDSEAGEGSVVAA